MTSTRPPVVDPVDRPVVHVEERHLAVSAETDELGRELSLIAMPGDIICLSGDLGAGKTTLARAFIRALAGGAEITVPSPTFTLVQHYDEVRLPVAHYDFYRLTSPGDIAELGLEESAESAVSLIEWPDRFGDNLPADRLDVQLEFDGQGRRVLLSGHGAFAARLERMAALARFLAAAGCANDSRRFLQGDASARRYERVRGEDGSPLLVMDMPARGDGPILRDGKPYSRLVHLAESCHAVLAINQALLQAGFSAPRTKAADVKRGFIVMEDLGDDVFGVMRARGDDVSEPLNAATDVLAAMAGRRWACEIPLEGETAHHRIEAYDDDALVMETSLLIDWYWPEVLGAPCPPEAAAEYDAAWRALLPAARCGEPVWCLRDYHSPNLIWLPQRGGLKRVGLIDTQDAVLGPAAYDLVSLLQDARLDWPEGSEERLFERYCKQRQTAEAGFDRAAFARSYAIMGAQRACKVLGIFHRLNRRDGKPGYLAHCPRVAAALKRNLAHPALCDLKDWFDRNRLLEPA